MTTGPVLGTSRDMDIVRKIVSEVGFNSNENPKHEKVDNLRLQIHNPSYLKGVEGVITEIEFDDISGRFPNNPEAIEVLRQLYQKMPDLQYLKEYFVYPQPVGPVSELLESIE